MCVAHYPGGDAQQLMAEAVCMSLRIRSRESYNLAFIGDSKCLFCLVSLCYVTALSSPGCLHRIAGIICQHNSMTKANILPAVDMSFLFWFSRRVYTYNLKDRDQQQLEHLDFSIICSQSDANSIVNKRQLLILKVSWYMRIML